MATNEPPPPFELSEGEKAHPLWLRLKAHMEMRLAQCRAKNDDTTLTEAETQTLRGQIRTLKGIIALGDDRPLTG